LFMSATFSVVQFYISDHALLQLTVFSCFLSVLCMHYAVTNCHKCDEHSCNLQFLQIFCCDYVNVLYIMSTFDIL